MGLVEESNRLGQRYHGRDLRRVPSRTYVDGWGWVLCTHVVRIAITQIINQQHDSMVGTTISKQPWDENSRQKHSENRRGRIRRAKRKNTERQLGKKRKGKREKRGERERGREEEREEKEEKEEERGGSKKRKDRNIEIE